MGPIGPVGSRPGAKKNKSAKNQALGRLGLNKWLGTGADSETIQNVSQHLVLCVLGLNQEADSGADSETIQNVSQQLVLGRLGLNREADSGAESETIQNVSQQPVLGRLGLDREADSELSNSARRPHPARNPTRKGPQLASPLHAKPNAWFSDSIHKIEALTPGRVE